MAQFHRTCALALALAGSAWAQQSAQVPPDTGAHGPKLTPRTHEEREHTYEAEHHVILNVLVTDRAGRPVTGLATRWVISIPCVGAQISHCVAVTRTVQFIGSIVACAR